MVVAWFKMAAPEEWRDGQMRDMLVRESQQGFPRGWIQSARKRMGGKETSKLPPQWIGSWSCPPPSRTPQLVPCLGGGGVGEYGRLFVPVRLWSTPAF